MGMPMSRHGIQERDFFAAVQGCGLVQGELPAMAGLLRARARAWPTLDRLVWPASKCGPTSDPAIRKRDSPWRHTAGMPDIHGPKWDRLGSG